MARYNELRDQFIVENKSSKTLFCEKRIKSDDPKNV